MTGNTSLLKRMNVLFLAAWYPTRNNPHKGLFVREHARAIAAEGHHVRVVVIDVSDGRQILSRTNTVEMQNGIETHIISLHSRWHKKMYAAYPLINSTVTRYIDSTVLNGFRPDIIHSNVLYPAGLIGNALAGKLNVPHIITEHWSKADRFLRRNLFAKKGMKALSQAAAVTCVSHFLRKRLDEFLHHTNKTVIIPNVVAEQFSTVQRIATHADELVFAASATWQLPKRPDLFVNALNAISQKTGRKISLHIFGDGPQLDAFKNAHFTPGFRIVYRGYCDKQEISEQLAQTNFFVHASEIETFSIVVAEALSTGTPVICSNRGALPELIKPGCGMLCENTSDDWEEKIGLAIEQTYDTEAIRKQSGNRFSAQVVGRAFTSLYTEVATSRAN